MIKKYCDKCKKEIQGFENSGRINYEWYNQGLSKGDNDSFDFCLKCIKPLIKQLRIEVSQ